VDILRQCETTKLDEGLMWNKTLEHDQHTQVLEQIQRKLDKAINQISMLQELIVISEDGQDCLKKEHKAEQDRFRKLFIQ